MHYSIHERSAFSSLDQASDFFGYCNLINRIAGEQRAEAMSNYSTTRLCVAYSEVPFTTPPPLLRVGMEFGDTHLKI